LRSFSSDEKQQISCVMRQVATKGSSMLRTKFWGDSVFPEFAH
jgi:hypothetical protein